MENVYKFGDLVNQVNKISSLNLENDERAVISSMVSNGIGASAFEAINKLSSALGTTEKNSFRTVQDSNTLFGPGYNAHRFNVLNKDVEALLESGYNAQVIDQNITMSDMLSGKDVAKKGELLLFIADKMNLNNDKNKTSYSDFDAKFSTVYAFMDVANKSNLRLAPSNKLYIYNVVIDLMNKIETNNISADPKTMFDNIKELSKINNPELKDYLKTISENDCSKVAEVIKLRKQVLDDTRKRLEKELFNKVETKFDMKTCHNNFAKAVEDIQRRQNAMCEIETLSF